MPLTMTRAAHHLAADGMGYDIAIAGRRQRDDRPPQRVGQAAEGFRLVVALEGMGRGGGHHQDDHEDDQDTGKRSRSFEITRPSVSVEGACRPSLRIQKKQKIEAASVPATE